MYALILILKGNLLFLLIFLLIFYYCLWREVPEEVCSGEHTEESVNIKCSQKKWKMSFDSKLWLSNSYGSASYYYIPLMVQILTLLDQIYNLSLEYQRFTTSSSKDIKIKKSVCLSGCLSVCLSVCP